MSADFANLEYESNRMKAAGADMLHIDVMDGHFVPNLTMGAPIVSAINKKCDLPLDVHLMISDPYAYIDDFIHAGADIITVHFECGARIIESIKKIKHMGAKVGLSIKPQTPVRELFLYLDIVDMVLIMAVEPGFGNQSFMADSLDKISFIRKLSSDIDIEVDGGINNDTSKLCINAGANILVAGSYIFNSEDAQQAISRLREG